MKGSGAPAPGLWGLVLDEGLVFLLLTLLFSRLLCL